jgi:hypothetical protein
MGPIRCPETSVKDYHSTLSNIPEECRSHLHRGGSLKSRIKQTRSGLYGTNWHQQIYKQDIVYEIWVSYRSVYEASSRLQFFVLSTGKYLPTFLRNVLLSSSVLNSLSFLNCLTLKMNAQHVSEKSLTIQQATRFNIPEDLNLIASISSVQNKLRRIVSRSINSLKLSGKCVYHLLSHSWILHFIFNLHLYGLHYSQYKQRPFSYRQTAWTGWIFGEDETDVLNHSTIKLTNALYFLSMSNNPT